MYRLERIASRIQSEISKLLFEELETAPNLITVTNVTVSPDGEHAAVSISVLPQSAEKAVLAKIQKNVWRLQQGLNKRLAIRPVPRLRFVSDAAGRTLAAVDEALKEIRGKP